MTLEKIFNLVEQKSYELRKNDIKADGQKFWQPIKNILSTIDIKADKWKHINKEYYKVMLSPEYYIDGYGNKKIIEENHFYIQTIRIPLLEEPTLRKIIQIALNIGQYTGSNNKKEKWMKLDFYLTKESIKKINSQIPNNLLSNLNENI